MVSDSPFCTATNDIAIEASDTDIAAGRFEPLEAKAG
jgi:hypothetical protein